MHKAFIVIVVLLISAIPLKSWVHGSATYYGLSATRPAVNYVTSSFDTTNKQLMARSGHFARSPISSIQIVTSNFYVDATPGIQRVETGSGATATVTASIEYPAGVCTQVLFSGVSSGSIADGNILLSDSIAVSIPSGAQFWVRQFWTSAGGAIYTFFPPGANLADMGDALRVAVSGLSDQTVSCGTVTKNVNDALHWPLGIISPMAAPSVCIIGDSIAAGSVDDYSPSGDMGSIARSIGPVFGYVNMAVPSEKAQDFINSHTQRAKMFSYCSAGIVEHGTNDMAAAIGATAAQLEGLLTTIYGYFSGPQVFQSTILPRPTTTDGCATLGNQTLPSWEAQRVIFNDALKTSSFGPISGNFDVASAIETSTDSGFWITSPRYSGDCIHPNLAGNIHIPNTGAINTARIIR